MTYSTESNLTGTVLEIQRMSTEDGPGIRTTVFMKGCPMHCLWCHNPESISLKPQIHWIGARCINCKTCLDACPIHAVGMLESGLIIDREQCDGCGKCAEACPSTAIELLGKKWTVPDLVYELLKDRAYFEKSGGGITISGGEATLQWKFVSTLLQELKNAGIHTAIDTCGVVKKEALDAILPYADLVLYDLKESDPVRHQDYTGCPLDTVINTLDYLSSYMRNNETPRELWIRTPLIPDATARAENIAQIGKLISERCNGTVARWDLLAFNNLCKDKYQRLGLDWIYKDIQLLASDTLEALASTAMVSGVRPDIVHWSGSTRLEGKETEETEPKPQMPSCTC